MGGGSPIGSPALKFRASQVPFLEPLAFGLEAVRRLARCLRFRFPNPWPELFEVPTVDCKGFMEQVKDGDCTDSVEWVDLRAVLVKLRLFLAGYIDGLQFLRAKAYHMAMKFARSRKTHVFSGVTTGGPFLRDGAKNGAGPVNLPFLPWHSAPWRWRNILPESGGLWVEYCHSPRSPRSLALFDLNHHTVIPKVTDVCTSLRSTMNLR